MGFDRLYISLLLAASATLAAETADAQQGTDPAASDSLPDLPATESQSAQSNEADQTATETIYATKPEISDTNVPKIDGTQSAGATQYEPYKIATDPNALRPCPKESRATAKRRAPTVPTLEYNPTPCNPDAPPEARLDAVANGEGLPDRWRVVSMLGYRQNLMDPYNGNNVLKGDRPMWGEDWFLSLLGIADTLSEQRRFALPVGQSSGNATTTSNNNTISNNNNQFFTLQTFALETIVYKGNTVFKPPDYEFRFTPVLGVSYLNVDQVGVVNANPAFGTNRTTAEVGLQSAFIDKHLRNVSDRYDFDSVRVGIQPFQSDFRGFLFNDVPLGARVFGTRANNRYQYNIGVFRRITKDTNTGLNDVFDRGGSALRNDYLGALNFYVQDFPRLGFTSQATVVYNRNREGNETFFDENGFLQRPSTIGLQRGSNYDVTYPGVNGDGKFGRYNLTFSAYGAFGTIANGLFSGVQEDIRAGFFAVEGSRDFSWARYRVSALYGTPDTNPMDTRATGFDTIFENPLIMGFDTSFFIHQGVPLIGGGGVALSQRNGMLFDLRTSKDSGSSNFTNPGTIAVSGGADFDIAPTLRLSPNVTYLAFADTTVLQLLRAQGSISREVGVDVSLALTWRPMAIQNVVTRLSVATLVPGQGFKQLFGNQLPYSVLGNVVLQY